MRCQDRVRCLSAWHPSVRQRQPPGEELRRFGRCSAIERHHCPRETGGAGELGAPPVADGSDFNVVRAPADGFLEAMKCHVYRCPEEVSG